MHRNWIHTFVLVRTINMLYMYNKFHIQLHVERKYEKAKYLKPETNKQKIITYIYIIRYMIYVYWMFRVQFKSKTPCPFQHNALIKGYSVCFACFPIIIVFYLVVRNHHKLGVNRNYVYLFVFKSISISLDQFIILHYELQH